MIARDLISREVQCTLSDLSAGVEFQVSGPSLIRANGLRVAALGGAGSPDFGELVLYYAPNASVPHWNAYHFQGNYAYLPCAGSWYITRAFAGVPSAASPVVATDRVSFTVFENCPRDFAENQILCPVANRVHQVTTAILNTVALDATGAADSWYGGSQSANGDYFNIIGACITNTGANPLFISAGNGTLTTGQRIAANGVLLFPPGSLCGMSALYGFSNLGATAQVLWYVR